MQIAARRRRRDAREGAELGRFFAASEKDVLLLARVSRAYSHEAKTLCSLSLSLSVKRVRARAREKDALEKDALAGRSSFCFQLFYAQVRTYLSESDAMSWAAAAAASQPVFVVLFSDGEISIHVDPATGEKGRQPR